MPRFSRCSMDDHLGCFQFLAFMNAAAVNICGHIFVWTYVFLEANDHVVTQASSSDCRFLDAPSSTELNCGTAPPHPASPPSRERQPSPGRRTENAPCWISLTTMTSGTSSLLLPCFSHSWWVYKNFSSLFTSCILFFTLPPLTYILLFLISKASLWFDVQIIFFFFNVVSSS